MISDITHDIEMIQDTNDLNRYLNNLTEKHKKDDR